jgi:hypothetical protein
MYYLCTLCGTTFSIYKRKPNRCKCGAGKENIILADFGYRLLSTKVWMRTK